MRLDPSKVTEVLLPDGWHEVRAFEYLTAMHYFGDVLEGDTLMFDVVFIDNDGPLGVDTYVPKSSVLALRTYENRP